MWSMLACSVVLLFFLMKTTKTSLVPDEDQGVLFVNVTTGRQLTGYDQRRDDQHREPYQRPAADQGI